MGFFVVWDFGGVSFFTKNKWIADIEILCNIVISFSLIAKEQWDRNLCLHELHVPVLHAT